MSPYMQHAAVEGEVVHAAEKYEQRRPGLGAEFLTELELAVRRVRENPLQYAAEDRAGTRFCPLHRFPYMLVYRVIDEAVWVAAVMHQHRRPGYWKRRKP